MHNTIDKDARGEVSLHLNAFACPSPIEERIWIEWFEGCPRAAHRPIQSEFHSPPTSTHLHISTSMQQLRLVNILYYSTP